MKFHNQRSFMGHEISNVNNKPLLHKKGKQWIVVAVSALILAGFGGMVSTTTHADTTNNGTQIESAASGNGSANSKPANSVSTTQNQAKALHINLLQNANVQKPSNLTATNNSSNYKHAFTLSATKASTAPASDVNAPKATEATFESTGTWNGAKWSYYSNHQLDIYNGNMNINGNTSDDIKNSPMHPNFPNFHASDVYYIKTSNVIAPVNSSALFAANGGFQRESNAQSNWSNLQSVDLSGVDTSSTTNMSGLFHGDSKLTHVTFGPTFDTSNVTSMAEMFDDDSSIQSLNMSSFDTSKVTDMTQMFWNMPNLRILDLHNFKLNSSLNPWEMFNINSNAYETPQLQEIVLNSDFKRINNNADLTKAHINSNSLEQLGSNGQPDGNYGNWSDAASKSGIWINRSSTHSYPLVFQDEFNQNKLINSGQSITFTGLSNSNPDVKIFLPISSGVLPSGYEFSPNEGDTATIDPSKSEAIISIIPANSLPSSGKGTYGTWNNAIWILSDNGDGTSNTLAPATLKLVNGTLGENVPPRLTDYLNHHHLTISNVQTKDVTAPDNSSNLFTGQDFENTKDFNLQGITFTPTAKVDNLVPANGTKEFNGSYYYALLGINGIEKTISDDNKALQSDINDINNLTNKNSTLSTEVSYANSVANSDASAVKSWKASSQAIATSLASAIIKSGSTNSAYISTLEAKSTATSQALDKANASLASDATSINSLKKTLSDVSSSASSASASASTNSAWIHNSGVPASTSANNAESWINNNSGSLSNASTAAVEAMTSLNNDSAELNWLANSENVLSSGTSQASSNAQWIKDNSASVQNINNQISALNTKIFTDKLALDNAINTKADSTSISNDEKVLSGTLTHDIDDLSTLNEQAKSLASADENWINANSNTAANGISNDNASASASASIANANADSYALSLANNATDTANVNAGGIDNTINTDDQTVQSLSNTVNTDTESLADNDNNLYQTKADKPAKKQNIKKVNDNLFYFYVIKPMWLHTSAKFTKGNRVKALTAKHGYTLPITRIFKFNGALRFEIKINGTKYFVTGNHYFTRNAYIQPNEIKRNSSIKVLRNIREYKRAGFNKKNFIRNFKRGSVLSVKKAKTIAGKQVTRLQLTNGHWITANKNLVKLI